GAARAGARTRAGAARLAGGRLVWATRLGFCFGTGTLIVGSDVVAAAGGGSLAGGDGALLCAHTPQGTSNTARPTHPRRRNCPAPRVHATRTKPANCLCIAASPRGSRVKVRPEASKARRYRTGP